MIAKAIEGQRKRPLGMRVKLVRLLAIFVALFAGAGSVIPATLQAQQSQEPPQQQTAPSSSQAGQAGQKKDQPQTPAADEHKYDALNAEKDIEVGTFYMHKGDIDAAIPRFEDAAKLRPDYGKPRLLLAEAYEKKKDPIAAVKYYKEYLKVYPHAPDAKKVQQKIEKLQSR